MPRHFAAMVMLAFCLAALGGGSLRTWADENAAGAGSSQASVHWQENVAPLFAEHCTKCHGAQKQMSGVDLRTTASVLAGGKNEEAIVVAGDPDASKLYRVLAPGAKPHMPPGDKQLSDEQRALVAAWIRALSTTSPTESAPESPAVADSLLRDLPTDLPASLVIDLLLERQAAQQKWQPAERCDDRTFARRVYLDVVSRIPTEKELNTFLDETDSNKREALIERLLQSSEYSQSMARLFDTLWMGRGSESDYGERLKHGWIPYLESCFAHNRPWNDVVAEILRARPANEQQLGSPWFLYERKDRYQEIAEAIAPAVFGIQIDCAQCHDHPLADEIEQRHYWGLVAFFNRGKNEMHESRPQIRESAIGGFSQFADLKGTSQENLLVFVERPVVMEPRPDKDAKQADGDELYAAVPSEMLPGPRIPRFSRREAFVEQVLTDHPRIARTQVNRIWGIVMGRGIVHPIDKMDSAHPPSHPVLLDWLSEAYRQRNYDTRWLMRQILNTRAYQRRCLPPDQQTPPESFCYSIEKPLTAEAMYRSIQVALGESADWNDGRLGPFRQAFPDVVPETHVSTLKQSLFLSNNPALFALIDTHDGNLLARIRDNQTPLEAVFRSAYGREPAEEERAAMVQFLKQRTDPQQGLRHLMWAIVTSAEFRYNH